MIKVPTLIYYITLIVVLTTIFGCGYDVKTFQYWVILIGMLIARICGNAEERY